MTFREPIAVASWSKRCARQPVFEASIQEGAGSAAEELTTLERSLAGISHLRAMAIAYAVHGFAGRYNAGLQKACRLPFRYVTHDYAKETRDALK
jgi:hypothetical protein